LHKHLLSAKEVKTIKKYLLNPKTLHWSLGYFLHFKCLKKKPRYRKAEPCGSLGEIWD